MVIKKRKKSKKKTEVTYNINWRKPSNIAAILSIILGIIMILDTFIHPVIQQCTANSFTSPQFIDFAIFGCGMIFMMIGISMLYAGRQRGLYG